MAAVLRRGGCFVPRGIVGGLPWEEKERGGALAERDPA